MIRIGSIRFDVFLQLFYSSFFASSVVDVVVVVNLSFTDGCCCCGVLEVASSCKVSNILDLSYQSLVSNNLFYTRY